MSLTRVSSTSRALVSRTASAASSRSDRASKRSIAPAPPGVTPASVDQPGPMRVAVPRTVVCAGDGDARQALVAGADHASAAAHPGRPLKSRPLAEPPPNPRHTPRVDHHAIWMAILEQVLKIPLFIRDRVPG